MANPASYYFDEFRKAVGIKQGKNETTLSFNFETIQDAKLTKKKIIQIQKNLRNLKKETGLEMKQIKSRYSSEKKNVQAGFFSTISGTKYASKDRENKRDALRRKEKTELSGYENVIQNIDNALLDLDKAKLDIDLWIAEQQKEA